MLSSATQRHTDRLTHYGPRPVGSYEADVQAVTYLLDQLAAIKTSKNLVMTVDTQTVSGTFHLESYNLFQLYSGVKNVVVRLSSVRRQTESAPAPALLVNCHFDSVPQSPGASDDAVSCGVMLETIRVLSTNNRQDVLRCIVLSGFHNHKIV